jgi:hypothetical protein
MRISKVAVEDEKLSVLKITLGWNQRILKIRKENSKRRKFHRSEYL